MNTGLDRHPLSSARRTVVCVVVHTTVKSARCALFVCERTKKMHKIIFSQAEEAQSTGELRLEPLPRRVFAPDLNNCNLSWVGERKKGAWGKNGKGGGAC